LLICKPSIAISIATQMKSEELKNLKCQNVEHQWINAYLQPRRFEKLRKIESAKRKAREVKDKLQ
jgi:hypothetical protein